MTRRKVREATPLQVYLAAEEQRRLDRLAGQLDTTKSDVVRRSLLALERELIDPAAHPALRLIGIAGTEQAGLPPADAARDHDRLLADAEEAGWQSSSPGRTRKTAKSPRKRRGR